MCRIDYIVCIMIFKIAVILPPAIVFSEQAVMHCYLQLITMILLWSDWFSRIHTISPNVCPL